VLLQKFQTCYSSLKGKLTSTASWESCCSGVCRKASFIKWWQIWWSFQYKLHLTQGTRILR